MRSVCERGAHAAERLELGDKRLDRARAAIGSQQSAQQRPASSRTSKSLKYGARTSCRWRANDRDMDSNIDQVNSTWTCNTHDSSGRVRRALN